MNSSLLVCFLFIFRFVRNHSLYLLYGILLWVMHNDKVYTHIQTYNDTAFVWKWICSIYMFTINITITATTSTTKQNGWRSIDKLDEPVHIFEYLANRNPVHTVQLLLFFNSSTFGTFLYSFALFHPYQFRCLAFSLSRGLARSLWIHQWYNNI